MPLPLFRALRRAVPSFSPLRPHPTLQPPSPSLAPPRTRAHSTSSPPPSLALLKSLSENATIPKDAWYLIALAVSVTLGHGHSWLPAIYRHAVSSLAPAPAEQTSSPPVFAQDPLPRRKVVRRLKEALVKGSILCGVPAGIGSSLALKDSLEPGDRDDSFVRSGFDLDGRNRERGYEALHRIYRDEMPLVGDKKTEMRDVEWFSYNITYGVFLAPISEQDERAPLSLGETEVLVLSCLVAQRAGMEVRWHLRGSLWAGLGEGEVEAVQRGAEEVGRELGFDFREGMPRVGEVVREMREEALKAGESG